MIKAEKTMNQGRINLIDTEIPTYDDSHWIRQISEGEALNLVRSLIAVLLPKDKDIDANKGELKKMNEDKDVTYKIMPGFDHYDIQDLFRDIESGKISIITAKQIAINQGC